MIQKPKGSLLNDRFPAEKTYLDGTQLLLKFMIRNSVY